MDLGPVILILIFIIFYTGILWFFFCFIREDASIDTINYQKLLVYKREMQNAQNTAKQYKKALNSKKKGYKTLQRKYSCLEQENKCLKAKLCQTSDDKND